MRDGNPLRQPPLNKYFQSPIIGHIASAKRKRHTKIDGVARFIEHISKPKAPPGLFITRPSTEEKIREAFGSYGPIRYIRCLKQCCFVMYEDGVDIGGLVGKHHRIGEDQIFVDAVRGSDPDFVPLRYRNRADLYHNRKSKFA
jgi:hypothetical protein